MTSGNGSSNLPSRRRHGVATISAAAAVLFFCLPASAQVPQPSPPPQQTARPAEPGMIESLGRWFKNSFDRIGSGVQDAGSTFGNLGDRATGAAKSAADAAKDAADAVSRLPGARVVNGRERCAVALNGAPDCQSAAETVCRGKGFASGASLDIQSAQKCPARVWLSRREPEPGECQVESFVTRAVCQ